MGERGVGWGASHMCTHAFVHIWIMVKVHFRKLQMATTMEESMSNVSVCVCAHTCVCMHACANAQRGKGSGLPPLTSTDLLNPIYPRGTTNQ